MKDIKILQAFIKTKKTAFTRFMGSEDVSSPGLLMDRLELWIGSSPEYPIISKTSELELIELTSQIIAEAVKARTDLCKAFSDYNTELSTLIVPEDHEQALLQATVEANKSSNKIMERTEEWFTRLCLRLVEMDDVVDIDEVVVVKRLMHWM